MQTVKVLSEIVKGNRHVVLEIPAFAWLALQLLAVSTGAQAGERAEVHRIYVQPMDPREHPDDVRRAGKTAQLGDVCRVEPGLPRCAGSTCKMDSLSGMRECLIGQHGSTSWVM